MLRQVAHIHVYRQTVVIGDLRFAENQRSKIVEQRLFDVVAGTVDPLSRNALCLVGDLADFRIGVIHGIRCVLRALDGDHGSCHNLLGECDGFFAECERFA